MFSVEGDFYEPGNPDTFGKPPRPLTWKDLEALEEDARYYRENPEAFLRLLHGQDEGLKRSFDLINRDRFLSAFPEIGEGVNFVFHHLPLMMEEYDFEEDLPQNLKEMFLFYDEILADFWEGGSQIWGGGLESQYISFKRSPEKESYEYIGESIGRAIRGHFHQDRSRQTQAFFGWIGRQVMKKVCPETDFSFDRHCQRVDEEKKEIMMKLWQLEAKVERGIEGEITLEEVYQFFGSLYGQFSSIDCAETPLQYQISTRIADARFDLPLRPDSTRSFGRFCQDWREAAAKGIPEVEIEMPWEKDFLRERGVVSYETWLVDLQRFISRERKINPRDKNYYDGLVWLLREYETDDLTEIPQEEIMAWYEKVETRNLRRWENVHLYSWRRWEASVFGDLIFDLEKMASVSREELLPLWFEMHRRDFLSSLKWVIGEARDFKTTYFRFIRVEPVAEGYAFAQEHIEEILANLPEIVRLPEGEVHRRYFSGEAKILSGEWDNGFNSGDDLYRDHYGGHPFDFEERQNLSKEEDRLLFLIEHGPNADLYKNLRYFEFTPEQWVLGVHLLFFGFDYSDREAEAFLADNHQEFLNEQMALTAFVSGERRIRELQIGAFSLPKNMADLLINLDLQRRRLWPEKNRPGVRRRLVALHQVGEILKEIQAKGLLKEPSD